MRRSFMNGILEDWKFARPFMSISRCIPWESGPFFRHYSPFSKRILRRLPSDFFLLVIGRNMIIRCITRVLWVKGRFINVRFVFINVIGVASRRFSPGVRVVRYFHALDFPSRCLVGFTCRFCQVARFPQEGTARRFTSTSMYKQPGE